jgi:methanogenic corrinoid protein MtbC1
MSVLGDVVRAAEAAGIRDQVKIMVGGAPVNEEFCQKIGADVYTDDAASAADAAVAIFEQYKLNKDD